MTKSRSILPVAPGLLHCWHHLMTFCFAHAFICFWLSLIVQFTSAFRVTLACAEVEGHCFYIIFSIVIVWRRSDLFNVICRLLEELVCTPPNKTLSKLVFTSHCICFCYIVICPVASGYTIRVTSFA